jgi:hypothetical protein
METQVAKTEMVHGAVVTTIMLTAALAVLLANKRQFIKLAWASCLLSCLVGPSALSTI